MLGRYVVELLLILLCGLGLHADEVNRTGASEAFVRFKKVSLIRYANTHLTSLLEMI